jgi:LAO/AO transport system kinase
MVDMVLLLVAPGGGDELQGFKRGIVETADLVVVTKDDGDLAPAAGRLAADYAAALPLVAGRGAWRPRVVRCSALTGNGVGDVAAAVAAFFAATAEARPARRAAQARARFRIEIREALAARLRADAEASRLADALEADVAAERMGARAAARRAIEAFLARSPKRP